MPISAASLSSASFGGQDSPDRVLSGGTDSPKSSVDRQKEAAAMLPKFFLCLLALASLSLSAAAQTEDDCRDVLLYSARNYSLETYDLSVAVRIYDQYCENDSVRAGTKFDASLGAVIASVPLKFGASSGSTEERTRHFCKTFDSDYKKDESKYRSLSLVVNETTNAWLACKTLAGQGILFRPKLSQTQVIIEVARTNARPASVQGVIYDPALLECTVPNTDKSRTRVRADGLSTKALSDSYWTITCVRRPSQTASELVYPKLDVSVTTTRGAFLLPVPADAQFPYQWASELQRQVDSIALRQSTLAASLTAAEARIPTGIAFGAPTNTGWQGDPAWANCPDGSVATGVIYGRQNMDANARCSRLELRHN